MNPEILTPDEIDHWTAISKNLIKKMNIRPMPVWDIEDMIQDVLLSIVRCKRRYNPSKSKFMTFAMPRAIGTLKDQLLSWTWQSKSDVLNHREVYQVVSIKPEHNLPFNQDFDFRLEVDLLESKLNEKEKEVFSHIKQGLELSEVAGKIKRSEFTVCKIRKGIRSKFNENW